MTTNEPQFLSEIQVKVECSTCEGRGYRWWGHGPTAERKQCDQCDGLAYIVVGMDEAIARMIRSMIKIG
jgi:DnaJ-class molecular chaperone